MATTIDTDRIFSKEEVQGKADSDGFLYAANRVESVGAMFNSLLHTEIQRAYLHGYANAIIWMQQAAMGRNLDEGEIQ